MKPLIVFLYFILIASASADNNDKILLKLSVACQNAHSEFDNIDPDGSIDPSFVTGYLKEINTALDALVGSGYLAKKKFFLKNPAEMDPKEQEALSSVFRDAIGKIYKKYGNYSAMEMVDMGIYRMISTVQKGEEFSVTIRLPKMRLQHFEEAIKPFLKATRPKK